MDVPMREARGHLFGFQGVLNLVVTDDSVSNLFRSQLSRSDQGSREPREVARVETKHVVEQRQYNSSCIFLKTACFCG